MLIIAGMDPAVLYINICSLKFNYNYSQSIYVSAYKITGYNKVYDPNFSHPDSKIY